jgi:uncharacterized protein GlcG (DUF336 family)
VKNLITARTIGLAAARQAVAEAVAKATSIGVPSCIAVVDRAGHLITYDRMDGAGLLSAQIAQDKAYTVTAFGVATHEWWDNIREDPSLLNGVIKTDRLIIFGGGVPILADGEIVGAIGVSGGSPKQDQSVAEAGAKAVDFEGELDG